MGGNARLVYEANFTPRRFKERILRALGLYENEVTGDAAQTRTLRYRVK
jgi:hypothetical protein